MSKSKQTILVKSCTSCPMFHTEMPRKGSTQPEMFCSFPVSNVPRKMRLYDVGGEPPSYCPARHFDVVLEFGFENE